ncbi:TrbG/VirB9 family P-type conjugative transfer protein, partial [Komagataeibacter kakiaceti]|uniref:TrbG/VirB9 family P-type conjugative transfer protein n=1 Tax=Komagataeibacter kakiaceti TaxID=943261 RepID=UPI00046F058B
GLAVAGLYPQGAGATGVKSTSPYDYRIKSVVYNPRDTVEVDGVVGIATDITLSPDEHYVTHAFGEEGGWSFACRENHCFIRPKEQESDTNLTIVTDRHVYHILLHYVGGRQEKGADGRVHTAFAATPWALAQATVELTYLYPDEEDSRKAAAAHASHIQAELADVYGNGPRNTAYRRSNGEKDRAIAPLNVWDDYRFTYFRFPENGVLPTLYVMNEGGQEMVVNAVVLGPDHNILAAQVTAREWRIRYGGLVIGVVNDAYNPSLGSTANGTISPLVRRVARDRDGDS